MILLTFMNHNVWNTPLFCLSTKFLAGIIRLTSLKIQIPDTKLNIPCIKNICRLRIYTILSLSMSVSEMKCAIKDLNFSSITGVHLWSTILSNGGHPLITFPWTSFLEWNCSSFIFVNLKKNLQISIVFSFF